ncbi:MAG: ABC transporter permease [Candidatus Latescibacterota bacterium]
MLHSYVVMAWRSLRAHPLSTLVSTAGLTTALAGCLLILLYVQHETSFDRFHPHADRLYRLVFDTEVKQPVPLAPLLAAEAPEVASYVRITAPGMFRPLISYGDRQFYQTVYLADETFFEVFAFPLVRGDARTALDAPHSMAISTDVARRYFGQEDPLGKVLRWDNSHDYRVTAVFALPSNTHLPLHLVGSMCTARVEPQLGSVDLDSWEYEPFYTYLLLREGASAAGLGSKALDVVERHAGAAYRRWLETKGALHLQPVPDIHLHSHFLAELQPGGDVNRVRLMIAAAVLVLLVACVNYGTLTAARVTTRGREAGVRRAAGATRVHLALQVLLESWLLALVCLVLALALVHLGLPAFGALLDLPLELRLTEGPGLPLLLLGLVTVVGLAGGAQPAWVLSTLEPVPVLHGAATGGRRGAAFRRLLVLLQFGLSIVLGTAALVVRGQMEFVHRRNLGFAGQQVLLFRTGYPGVREKAETIRQAFRDLAGVVGVSTFHYIPSGRYDDWVFADMGRPGQDPRLRCAVLTVDDRFVDVFGLDVVAGRGFDPASSVDAGRAVLLNRAAARQLGYDPPEAAVGAEVVVWGGPVRVVGVVRDFHFESLYHAVEPAVLRLPADGQFYLATAVRIRPDHVAATLRALEQVWRDIVPFYPMGYWFVDQEYARLYGVEERLARVLEVFALLAVAVASLGAFSLAAFAAAQRAREVAVRKVLGASVAGVVMLLCRESTALVLAAGVLAWPVAHLALVSWLQTFAYRIDVGVAAPILAGLSALGVAWLAVASQAMRAALANPVDALRGQ